MDTSKNYYSILGVVPSAEAVVIRAAYRALALRYHPDTWRGDKAHADQMIRALNEAYEVLSNAGKRKAYDAARRDKDFEEFDYDADQTGDAFRAAEAEQDPDWALAVDYFPDLTSLYARLRRTSSRLAFAFRTTILETKRYDDRHSIATQLEESFMRTYFGTQPQILKFAQELIQENRRAAARDLNRAVSVLGNKIDPKLIISRIREKHYKKSIQEIIEKVLEYQYVEDAFELIAALGGKVSHQLETKLFSTSTRLYVTGFGETRSFHSERGMVEWLIAEVIPDHKT